MLSFPANVRLYLANRPVDGRKSFNGLAAVVEAEFDLSPLSGDIFVFLTRRANLVRMLFWDRDGFCLVSKKLEKGTFKRVWHAASAEGSHIELDVAELTLLLEGIESKNLRRAPRWRPEEKAA